MTYTEQLAAWLAQPGRTEHAMAKSIGKAQPTVNRYRNGKLLPDAATARLIDAHTSGHVPFAVWQGEFLRRSGIAA